MPPNRYASRALHYIIAFARLNLTTWANRLLITCVEHDLTVGYIPCNSTNQANTTYTQVNNQIC